MFNRFLVNYVAFFFVILDFFVYCLWPLHVNTNGGYFLWKKEESTRKKQKKDVDEDEEGKGKGKE